MFSPICKPPSQILQPLRRPYRRASAARAGQPQRASRSLPPRLTRPAACARDARRPLIPARADARHALHLTRQPAPAVLAALLVFRCRPTEKTVGVLRAGPQLIRRTAPALHVLRRLIHRTAPALYAPLRPMPATACALAAPAFLSKHLFDSHQQMYYVAS